MAFNPTRLDLARRYRGVDYWDVAQAVGVQLPEIMRYAQGQEEPSEGMVARFGLLLRFPVEFFHGPTLDEPQGVSHL